MQLEKAVLVEASIPTFSTAPDACLRLDLAGVCSPINAALGAAECIVYWLSIDIEREGTRRDANRTLEI